MLSLQDFTDVDRLEPIKLRVSLIVGERHKNVYMKKLTSLLKLNM